jgi:hypothetical protein
MAPALAQAGKDLFCPEMPRPFGARLLTLDGCARMGWTARSIFNLAKISSWYQLDDVPPRPPVMHLAPIQWTGVAQRTVRRATR